MAFSAEIALNSWFKMSVVVAWDLKEVLYQIYEQKLSYQYAIIGDLATNKLLHWLNKLSQLGTKKVPHGGQHFWKPYGGF